MAKSVDSIMSTFKRSITALENRRLQMESEIVREEDAITKMKTAIKIKKGEQAAAEVARDKLQSFLG